MRRHKRKAVKTSSEREFGLHAKKLAQKAEVVEYDSILYVHA